jgi:2-phospho-L-lactate/phosphoenolpyruvate guanylyltransferase
VTNEVDIWAVLPIKDTALAKQRLSALLSAGQRTELARAMLHDVIDAVAASRSLAGVMFVTIDPFARALAQRIGACILDAGASDGQTAAITAAARMLAAERRGAMLTIPGDVPLVTAAEIDTVIGQHPVGDAFTIVPSHDELGSNAVLCSPPDRVPLRFGDNSYRPHVEAARRCGLVPKIVRLPGLALDIDRPRDVKALLRAPVRTRAHAILQKFGIKWEQNPCQQIDDTNIGH